MVGVLSSSVDGVMFQINSLQCGSICHFRQSPVSLDLFEYITDSSHMPCKLMDDMTHPRHRSNFMSRQFEEQITDSILAEINKGNTSIPMTTNNPFEFLHKLIIDPIIGHDDTNVHVAPPVRQNHPAATKYPTPSSKYPIPPSKYPIPPSKYPMPPSKYPIPPSNYPIPHSKYPIPPSKSPAVNPLSRVPEKSKAERVQEFNRIRDQANQAGFSNQLALKKKQAEAAMTAAKRAAYLNRDDSKSGGLSVAQKLELMRKQSKFSNVPR
jgi:hypothetical protein